MEEENSAVKYEKKLMTIDEFCKYVGIGKTKARELIAKPVLQICSTYWTKSICT